jgi:hypothetical protein
MNSSRLRQFWSLIEESPTETVLKLNDSELVKQLLSQLENRQPLSPQENHSMKSYIRSRTLLIREMVEAHFV